MSTYPDQIPAGAELYHWAPAGRRKSIARYGIQPGKPSVLVPRFRPPFVCFGLQPLEAWQMSAQNHPNVPEWDLWTVSLDDLVGVSEVLGWDDGRPKEVRLYGGVPARDLFYAGTRRQDLDYRGREPKPNDRSTKESP